MAVLQFQFSQQLKYICIYLLHWEPYKVNARADIQKLCNTSLLVLGARRGVQAVLRAQLCHVGEQGRMSHARSKTFHSEQEAPQNPTNRKFGAEECPYCDSTLWLCCCFLLRVSLKVVQRSEQFILFCESSGGGGVNTDCIMWQPCDSSACQGCCRSAKGTPSAPSSGWCWLNLHIPPPGNLKLPALQALWAKNGDWYPMAGYPGRVKTHLCYVTLQGCCSSSVWHKGRTALTRCELYLTSHGCTESSCSLSVHEPSLGSRKWEFKNWRFCGLLFTL